MQLDYRSMLADDLDEVVAIERAAFEFPWSAKQLDKFRLGRRSIGWVFVDQEADNLVVGYLLLESTKTQFLLLNLAVHADYRRLGVGTAMVALLKKHLADTQRQQIHVEVRDSNLAAHLFFKAQGFRATEIISEAYQDCDDDALVFKFLARQLKAVA